MKMNHKEEVTLHPYLVNLANIFKGNPRKLLL